MTISSRFLASKVARRIFAMFVVCALVPISALAVVAFGQVSAQLYSHGEQRLATGVRAVGQGIVERLLLLEAELRFSDPVTAPGAARQAVDPDDPLGPRRFLGVARVTGATRQIAYGQVPATLPPMANSTHLDAGRTLLLAEARPGRPPQILLVRRIGGSGDEGSLLVGAVDPTYLWAGGEDTLPRNNHLCVFAETTEPLFCTAPADGDVPANVTEAIAGASSGALRWRLDENEQAAAYWSMPLRFQFGVSHWTVMLSESSAAMLAPMNSFRRIFPLVVLLSMWVVLLLSIGQIRRSLVPLERLREGTRNIGARRFDSRVEVTSGDEFEELGEAFNDMATRLGKQFGALATIAEIDRTILSSLNIEKIVYAVLHRTGDLVACRALSITLRSPDQQKVPRTYTLRHGEGNRPWVETTFFEPEDFRRFDVAPRILELAPEDGAPPFLAPLARVGCQRFLVFPMFINKEPSGAIALGFEDEPPLDDEDRERVRQLSDQVAVALSNAHLVEDLDALNWGTLTALARTVDAKSSWTAGHSERVTAMGVKIGEAMDLEKHELNTLHRGGLLHDIGKIGVPASILDKPARLTEEEYDLMKRHPEIGANILQPIAAYADVIPIVHQHHERWDGSGYPNGLSGKRIHLYARIFAVADVYDALISDRPYRPGLPPEEVVRTIVAGDGTEFDPAVVAAFLDVMSREGIGPASRRRVAGAIND